MHKDYFLLLENTRVFIEAIPGVLVYKIIPNHSKYVPDNVESFGVEIHFKSSKELNVFMEHPKHYEANATFEEYLADPPYMVLTHEVKA